MFQYFVISMSNSKDMLDISNLTLLGIIANLLTGNLKKCGYGLKDWLLPSVPWKTLAK